MKTAIFPSSHWGSNIGNAFFYLGTEYILKKAGDVKIINSDLPPTKAFGLNARQQKKDVGYGYRLGKFDYLVLDGPMFDQSFDKLFGPYLKRALELDIRVILMSTGGIDYSKEEVSHCREVLKKYPPFILTTRDSETFKNFGDLAHHSYDAICSAWFVSDAYPGYSIPDENPYVTACFDHAVEPNFDFVVNSNGKLDWDSLSIAPVYHSKATKIFRLLQRDFKKEIGGLEIIRPCHQVLNRDNWRLFFKDNTFCSQTVFGYLNLYRNTKFTITDRLHASVATMAYGNPARLFIKSKRTQLLSRVKTDEVTQRLFYADMIYLAQEKEKYIKWMAGVLAL